jgi:hypothetical protein
VSNRHGQTTQIGKRREEKKSMNVKATGVATIVVGLLCATDVHSCSIVRPVSNVEMVREADAIVRATTENYAVEPKNPGSWSGFVPDSRIRFKILEVIRGKLPTDYVVLPGLMVATDDFNDHASPYTLVRPDGRHGNCFATSYRSGGQFLLILKKNRDGEFTVYWYALGPVNEQLRSADDPWLLWVRKEAEKPTNTSIKRP